MKLISRTSSLLLILYILSGCTTAPPIVQPEVPDNGPGYTESGQASYYDDKHQNSRTASGELYKHDLKTAAHRTLPFGSKVEVTNIDNGKSVIVKINDRGPLLEGRIIDLSKSAFSSIGDTATGVINVKIELIQ